MQMQQQLQLQDQQIYQAHTGFLQNNFQGIQPQQSFQQSGLQSQPFQPRQQQFISQTYVEPMQPMPFQTAPQQQMFSQFQQPRLRQFSQYGQAALPQQQHYVLMQQQQLQQQLQQQQQQLQPQQGFMQEEQRLWPKVRPSKA